MSQQFIADWCERQTATFTKRFAKRYITFDIQSRTLTYAEDEVKGPKGSIIVARVTRCCELMEMKQSELTTLQMSGTHTDGKEDEWLLRMPDIVTFEKWYRTVREACSLAGLMEAYNGGLPPVDPRTDLPFVDVPLSHLFRFAKLEQAVIHFFGEITLLGVSPQTKAPTIAPHILVVGDQSLYIFRLNAEVVLCKSIGHISRIFHGPSATFFALRYRSPTPDVVFKDFNGGVELAKVLGKLFEVGTGKKLKIYPINVPTAEMLVQSQQLRLTPDEGYKVHVAAPTTKVRLSGTLKSYRKPVGATEAVERPSEGGAVDTTASIGNPDMSTPLARFLSRIGLQQYTATLLSQHVDLDVLQCMDTADLQNFGVTDAQHCDTLANALKDSRAVADASGATTLGSGVKHHVDDRITLSDNDDAVPINHHNPPVSLDYDSDEDLLLGPGGPAAASHGGPITVDDDDL